MNSSKLQAALDELERLRDTVRGYKDRNGSLPHPDSDAGRALSQIVKFNSDLDKLNLNQFTRPS